MVQIKPFCGLRPPKHLVEQIECRPYDVLNSQEARQEKGNNEMSFYRIIRPEVDFPEGTSEYQAEVYQHAAHCLKMFEEKGWLQKDTKENYYLYAQTMNGKTQYGLVVGAHVADYFTGAIKKHELTRKDKEEDRMKHVRICDANTEPVFLAYESSDVLNRIIESYAKKSPEYDFIAPIDGFRHMLWVIEDLKDIATITEEFKKIPALYIADGHHRSAAAALIGAEKAKQNPQHKGNEEYNYFMAVCFPANQLTILDYNRLVKDINGYTPEEFIHELKKDFEVIQKGCNPYRPTQLHEFSMYLDGQWYSLTALPGRYNDKDPIGKLDVDISSRLILDKLLNIKDLRTDKRIDFVGGLRGLEELQRRVDSGEMRLALALYPVSMEQIITIADKGEIMPPKATWFEPKLRSGLIIHQLKTNTTS